MSAQLECEYRGTHDVAAWKRYAVATLWRIPATTGVWALFGVTVGLSLLSPGAGSVAIVAMAIAGLIVYVPMGVLLAVAGAKWKETAIGGTAGFLAAVAAARFNGIDHPGQMAAFGVTFGALLGGTVMTVGYRLPRLILGQLREVYRSTSR